jgi:hypothetical protein
MALQQVRFLGASVTNFNSNLGWGGEESRLEVGLVEDLRNGDGFNPPDVGAPVKFEYQGWYFTGLLERYVKDRGSNGNPVYNLTVVDPRVLLSGVQLILSDYYGPVFGVPNALNIFGYLESFDFGNSQKTISGIPYQNIIGAIHALTLLETPSLYGGQISYKGYTYNIILSNLPLLPLYYRVSGNPTISLLDFINDICEAGACEYFVTLEGSTITIHTISRFNIPLKGAIDKFIEQTPGAVSKNVGLDMVNEVNSKFLIGGAVTDVFFAFAGTGPDGSLTNSFDNPIWYYWGKDLDGNVVTSNGPTQNFYLDARSVLIQGIGDFYQTDINEMRACLASQDSWESFLWFNCFNQYLFDGNGIQQDYIYKIDGKGNFVPCNGLKKNPFIVYKHNGVPNPHFRKAYDIGLGARIDYNIVQFLVGANAEDILKANPRLLLQAQQEFQTGIPQNTTDDMSKLYNLIHSYADEYYGRKFMVSLPTVFIKQDSETGEFSFSHNTTDCGYLTEDVLLTASQNNLMPLDTSSITTLDGRISAYVRFDDIANLDLREIDPQDLMFGANLIKTGDANQYSGTQSIFVRCTVEPDFVYPGNDFTTPRAVISLTSRVFLLENTLGEPRAANKIIAKFLQDISPAKVKVDPQITQGFSTTAPTNPTSVQSSSNTLSQDDYTKISEKLNSFVNSDIVNLFSYPTPVIPNMAAVPIKSNIDTYGPWYATSGDGKIEIEYAEDLVPWNYDGYLNMNLAANARVSLAIANMQWVESGSISFPGVPFHQLGSQLLAGGPYVAGINVEIGPNGVITTYTMRSWNPQFGKIPKYVLDRVETSIKQNQELRKNVKEQLNLNSFKNIYLQLKKNLPQIQ